MYDVILRHYADARDDASSNDYVIHSYKTPNDHSRKLINPNLDIEENTAGTLKFTVPPGNAGNGYTGEHDITMGTDEIIIRRTVVRSIQTLANGVLQVNITMLEGKLSAQFSAGVNGTLDINWGDNSTHDTMTESSVATSKTITHDYSTAGNYVLTLTPSEGTLFNFVNMATEFWRGFPETSTKDFYNNVEYTCLGELAYLSDTVQEKKTYNYNTQDTYEHYPKHYLRALIAVHNAHCGHKKQFKVGNVTVTAQDKASKAINRTAEAKFETTPSQTTFECIQNLISNCGGHLEIRWDGSDRYLDYLKDYAAPGSSGVPIVQFATNLIDYTRETDLSDLITVLYPYGQTTNEVDSEGKLVKDPEGNTIRKTVDITSVNNGKPYIEYTGDSTHPQNYLAMYGRHEASVTFSNVADASNLLKLGQLYLYNQPFVYETLSCKAVDMIYAPESTSTAPIDYLKKVKVKSIPHGTDENGREFVVTKLSLPIDTPEETIYSMSTGSRKTQQISTSVKDHDDKQKDTDDNVGDIGNTVDDIGGGGEEIIVGSDNTDEWVVGIPKICKEPSTAKGKDYLAKSDHLKAWYDYSGTVDMIETIGDGPVDHSLYTTASTGSDGWTISTSNGYSMYDRRTYVSAWHPSYISDDLKKKDDEEAYIKKYTSNDVTVTCDNPYSWANINPDSDFSILSYYVGPNNYGLHTVYGGLSDKGHALNPLNMSYILALDNPNVAAWDSSAFDYGEPVVANGPWGTKVTPMYDSRGNLVDADTRMPPGFTGNAKFYGPMTMGIMPMLQRPFSGLLSKVVYVVATFGHGTTRSSGHMSSGGIGVKHSGSGSGGDSDYISQKSPSNAVADALRNGSSSYKIGFYNIKELKSVSELSYKRPMGINPKGHKYVYAWVKNITPGKDHPYTSAFTGGVLVHANGAVYCGCKKWIENYRKYTEDNGYELAEEFPGVYNNLSSYQLVTINKGIDFQGNDGVNFNTRTNKWRPNMKAIAGHSVTDLSGGSIAISAIGYCIAGYGQINMDEVVENLNFLAGKYGSD